MAGFARSALETVEAGSLLVPAVARLREQGLPCLQVVDRGQPIGLLTLENIGEFLMIRAALGSGLPSRSPRAGRLTEAIKTGA